MNIHDLKRRLCTIGQKKDSVKLLITSVVREVAAYHSQINELVFCAVLWLFFKGFKTFKHL